jgi:aryl-alcohol dehydrogenase-like predicted oxidoreductase
MNKILGTAQLARSYGAVTRRTSNLSEVDAIRLLQLAEIKGFHAIDTAPIYGTAEAIVGRSGVKLEVHTKLDPTRSVIDSVDSSLRLLKRFNFNQGSE